MEADRGGVDDMVELPAISEKDIAENLRVRLKTETIYVSNIKDHCSLPWCFGECKCRKKSNFVS